jgi:hypothetical protein
MTNDADKPDPVLDRLDALLAQTPRGVTRSQSEIARACGLSGERIGQIERAALAKIRVYFAARNISFADFQPPRVDTCNGPIQPDIFPLIEPCKI